MKRESDSVQGVGKQSVHARGMAGRPRRVNLGLWKTAYLVSVQLRWSASDDIPCSDVGWAEAQHTPKQQFQ
jgi:hypothetical protein